MRAVAVPEDAGRVRRPVPQVRRGLQADAEERADGEDCRPGQGARRLCLRDAEGGRGVGGKTRGRGAGGARPQGGAGVPRLRLPHQRGAGGREREDS